MVRFSSYSSLVVICWMMMIVICQINPTFALHLYTSKSSSEDDLSLFPLDQVYHRPTNVRYPNSFASFKRDVRLNNPATKRMLCFFHAVNCFVGIFLLSTIILTILLVIGRNKTVVSTSVNNDVCLTPFCIKAANYLLDSIDKDVQPCEDFYQFACGTWLRNNRIPDDAGSQDTFNVLRTQLDNNVVDLLTSPLPNDTKHIRAVLNARSLYDSCVNESAIEGAGVEAVLNVLENELGGWPMLRGSAWDPKNFNLSKLLIKLREYNNNIIYNCGTATDDKNSSAYYIRISQSDLGLEQRQYYLNESKLTEAYRQFMRDLAMLLANDTQMVERDVRELYEFERKISKFHWTAAEQRAKQNETIRTTIGNLSRVFDTSFDFTNYLRQIYLSANITLHENDSVSISEFDFLRQASKLIDEQPARVLQNYFIWRFMMNRASNMPKRYRAIREQFDRAFRGTNAERARSITCGSYVNINMGFAVAKLYIKKYFDENARNQSLEMIRNIRNTFIDMLNQSTWMDDKSKGEAIKKASAIDEKIGYPDYLASDNVTEIETDYAEYRFNSSYIHNILLILQIKAREQFRILREPVDRRAWGASPPTVVNAFYTPSKNQITFPAGILQMPFFNKDAPKYLNYGGIGAVIGHEITHGFDDNGRQYDKEGNRVLWWTTETIDRFNKRKKCIVDQYSNYFLEQINHTVDGNQTQGENIADNGGMKEAFYAYQDWQKQNGGFEKKLPGLSQYSSEQMFFINYAQVWCSKMTNSYAMNRILSGVHSPGQFRVLGPTSNFAEFDRVFKCRPGQGNSRVEKCTVW